MVPGARLTYSCSLLAAVCLVGAGSCSVLFSDADSGAGGDRPVPDAGMLNCSDIGDNSDHCDCTANSLGAVSISSCTAACGTDSVLCSQLNCNAGESCDLSCTGATCGGQVACNAEGFSDGIANEIPGTCNLACAGGACNDALVCGTSGTGDSALGGGGDACNINCSDGSCSGTPGSGAGVSCTASCSSIHCTGGSCNNTVIYCSPSGSAPPGSCGFADGSFDCEVICDGNSCANTTVVCDGDYTVTCRNGACEGLQVECGGSACAVNILGLSIDCAMPDGNILSDCGSTSVSPPC